MYNTNLLQDVEITNTKFTNGHSILYFVDNVVNFEFKNFVFSGAVFESNSKVLSVAPGIGGRSLLFSNMTFKDNTILDGGSQLFDIEAG
jgi:hypothetical protein